VNLLQCNDLNRSTFRPTFVAIFLKVLHEGNIMKTSKPIHKYKIFMTNVKQKASTTLRLLSLS